MSDVPERSEFDTRGLSKNRIEALADGIFAVAMTLLVLDIKLAGATLVRHQHALLIDDLLQLEHSFAIYFDQLHRARHVLGRPPRCCSTTCATSTTAALD